jgi:hypothetical protein
VELAELSLDPDFRTTLRQLADEQRRLAEDQRRLTGDRTGEPADDGPVPPRPDVVAVARDAVGAAVASGLTPESPRADCVVATLTARCALADGGAHDDDAEVRRWLLERLETAIDPRRDRYLQLLALINGWPAPEPLAPLLTWTVKALRVRVPR